MASPRPVLVAPAARSGTRRVDPVEALEDPLGLLRGEARAGVGDLDHGLVRLAGAAAASPASRRGVGQRVGHQVADHLAQPRLVADAPPGPRRSGSTSSVIVRSRRDGAGGLRPRRWRAPAARPAPARAAAPGPAGPAAAGPRRAGPSGRLVLDPPQQLRGLSGSATAPCRYSSAKPRMVVSGVRSSWEASATNCRIRSSERRARASDDWAASAALRAAASADRAAASEAARAVKAASIWLSMALSARESRPSSVLGSASPASGSGTRRVRSPPAIAAAVCSISHQRPQAGPHDARRRSRRAGSAPRCRPGGRSRTSRATAMIDVGEGLTDGERTGHRAVR